MICKRILFVFAINFKGEHDTISSMAEEYSLNSLVMLLFVRTVRIRYTIIIDKTLTTY